MTAGMPPAAWKSSMYPGPVGLRSTSTGVVSLSSLRRRRSMAIPRRPAIAVRWMIALVEPPRASSTRSAFSNACSGRDPARLGVIGADQGNRDPAGVLGDPQAIGIDRRYGSRARRHHAERLGERGHGTGRPHHGASPGRRRQPVLELLDLVALD